MQNIQQTDSVLLPPAPSHSPVDLAITGPLAWLTLNRPETRNAISEADMIDGLINALSEADAWDAVRVIIITGAGAAFCSGGNLKDMAARKGIFAGTPAQITEQYRQGIQRIPKAFASLRKPTLAAVNGAAYGAGCDIAMMCDLRLASTQAVFAENFVKVGLIPGDGGAWFLPRVIGAARAAEMALTGKPIPAETALAWGMVSQVTQPQDLLAQAARLAMQVAENPPWVVAMTRQLLQESAQTSLDVFLDRCAQIQGTAHHMADHREAVAALLEKRSPCFSGS